MKRKNFRDIRENRFGDMSTLMPKNTGLAYKLVFLPKSQTETGPARIKVQIGKKHLNLTISENPIWIGKIPESFLTEERKSIEDWVRKHETALFSHWNRKITDLELFDSVLDWKKKSKEHPK